MPPLEFFADPRHQPFDVGAGECAALLIHGFTGTPGEMRPIGESLIQKGWHVVAAPMPGFGTEILKLGECSYQDWIAGARAAWLNLRQAHQHVVLHGHSMGGAVALNVAALDPPDALILTAPFWSFQGIGKYAYPLTRFFLADQTPFKGVNFDESSVRAQVQRIYHTVDWNNPALLEEIGKQYVIPQTAVNQLRLIGLSAYKVAAQVKAPTLIVQGDADPNVPIHSTRQLAKRIGGNVRLEELAGANHDMVDADNPHHAQTVELMLDFLTGLKLV